MLHAIYLPLFSSFLEKIFRSNISVMLVNFVLDQIENILFWTIFPIFVCG